jgi:hypothetical protein
MEQALGGVAAQDDRAVDLGYHSAARFNVIGEVTQLLAVLAAARQRHGDTRDAL